MKTTANHYPFLQAGGRMSQFMREYDWSDHRLGSPEQWPSSLRVSVSNLLRTNLPTWLIWGSELTCFYNDAALATLEPTVNPLVGQAATQFWRADDWTRLEAHLKTVFITGQPVSFDWLSAATRAGSTISPQHFFASQVLDDQGNPGGVLLVTLSSVDDVSIASNPSVEARLWTMIESAPVAIALFRGPDHIIETANEAYQRLVGRQAMELLGKPMFEAMPEVKALGYEQLLAKVLTTGEPYHAQEMSVPLRRGDQVQTVYVNFTYQPLRAFDNSISGVAVIASDVTDQVVARRQIEASEATLHFALSAGQLGFWELDLQTEILQVSVICKQNFGQPLDQPFTYQTLQACIHPEDLPRQQQQVATSLATNADYDIEYRVIWPDNSIHWLHIRGQLRRNQAGVATALAGISIDITERKHTEQALRESEARFGAAVAAVQGILWTNNATGEMVGGQPGWANLTGQTYEQYQGYGWAQAVHPADVQPTIEAWQEAVQKRHPFVFEHRVKRSDGTWGLYAIRAIPIITPQGLIREWVGVHTDITQQRAIEDGLAAREAQLQTLSEDLDRQVQERTQQLQALVGELQRSNEHLQQFAYVASHDLQEPLRKIQSFGLMLLDKATTLDEDSQSMLQRMIKAGERMATLVQDLLAFSRISTQPRVVVRVDLSTLLEVVLDELEISITQTGAQIHVAALPSVRGDKGQLMQLFQNLLSNAIKFVPAQRAPEITVHAQKLHRDALPPNLLPTSPAHYFYQITITDNGIGFDAKHTERIFQIFQRLHGRNQYPGTGIGLAICQRVAQSHGGGVTAASSPGRGATFSVYLPVDR